MISGKVFSRIRSKQFDCALKEHGFNRCAHLYIRERDNLLQGIEFQTARSGGRFTLNLGFTYTFTPSARFEPNLRVTEYHLSDFLFYRRVAHAGIDGSGWWEYGETPEEARVGLRDAIDRSVDSCERINSFFADPEVLFLVYPLSSFERNRKKTLSKTEDDPARKELMGWDFSRMHLAYFLSILARRNGDMKKALAYISAAERSVEVAHDITVLKALREAICTTDSIE